MDYFKTAVAMARVHAAEITGDMRHLKADEDVAHDDAVQMEVDMQISDEGARALYKAAKVALARGNLEAVTEHMLRDAVKKAEAL